MANAVTPTEPVFATVSAGNGVGTGTLTHTGNDWTLDLGTYNAATGSIGGVANVEILNETTGAIADTLTTTADGSGSDIGDVIDSPTEYGFIVLGGFAAGFLKSDPPGSYTETIAVHPVDTQQVLNASTLTYTTVQTVLPDLTLTIIAAVVCFLSDTRIATDSGPHRVQDLTIGAHVKANFGETVPVKWIGHRSIDCRRHTHPQDVWPVRIRAGAFGDRLPERDLLLSPEHAVFADGVLVPVRCLVNVITIAQEPHDEVTYYHVELDRHDVIFAEGLPCESWLDTGNRAMFANCPVTDLYPSFARGAGHAWRHDACATLVEAGPEVDAIRARLNALAGTDAEDTSAHQAGELRGWIDSVTTAAVVGWARQPEHPDHPARLEILADDALLGEAIADKQREDVRDAGHGDGRCGFAFRLPSPLSPFKAHTIRVRRAADAAELGNSGRVIAAAEHLDAATLIGFATALSATSAAAGAPERAGLLRFMADETDRLRTLCARPAAAPLGSRRPLALFIDERLPAPDLDSASQVALDHMRSLRDLGYHVAFAACDASDGDAAPLDALGVTVCRPPAIASVEEMLRRLGTDAALVYLHRVTTASLYAGLVRHHCPQALLVYSVADLHFLRTGRQAALEGRGDLAAESRRLRDRELLAANVADRVITHSPVEAAIPA